MAKKPKSSGWSVPHIPFSLKPETARSIYAVLAILATLLFLVAPIGQAGVAGKLLYETLSGFFGVGYFLIPLSLMLFAIGLMREKETGASGTRLLGATVLFLAGISVLSIVNESGGIAGHWVGTPFVFLFDTGFAVVILGGIAIAGSLIALDTPFSLPKKLLSYLLQFLKRTPDSSMVITDPYKETGVENQTQETRKKEETLREKKPAKKAFREETAEVLEGIQFAPADTAYSPPPLSLLERDKGKPEVGDIKANANLIKRTLQNFGITVEMDEVSIGPSVTRYALKPAEGVRLSKILSLQNNLELALAAHPVRIEAPIPGKSLVGIEVPNMRKATVGLASLLSEDKFQNDPRPLLFSLGRDIAGASHFANITKMPHLLVAGATGSGKTCGKNTYVFSERGMLTFDELCPLPLNSDIDYSLRVATRDGVETTSKNYNNGICDFYKITTKEGFSIDITEEHPLWVLQDGAMRWQSGGTIRVGEYVAISRGSKLFGEDIRIDFTPELHKTNKARGIRIPAKMTRELGLFMGLLTADGGLTIKNRIVYTQANEEVIGIYITLLKDLFGITGSTTTKSGSSNKAKDIIVHRKQLKELLSSLGLKSVRAQEKEIPTSIRQSGPEVIKAFVQGLIRNDGHISPLMGLEITLANEKLIQQLQIILLNFGIVSSVHPKKVKGYEQNAYWRLAIYGADFALYAAEIGFLTNEEKDKAEHVLARKRNTNKNTIPTLAPTLKKLSLMYRTAFARITNAGWQYQTDALVPKYAFRSLRSYNAGVRNPSYEALERIATFYEPLAGSGEYQKIAGIRKDNFYWARVAKIEKTNGIGYDFEVPGSNSFVGNGFINHNSVAIHALITSLLYRNGPASLRFIMVDPKRVELTLYNAIPHLLSPVITEPKKAILALKWAAKEMERRYDILEKSSVRDIQSYHENIVTPASENRDPESRVDQMPYIVIVVDELADIMQSYPRELEAAIVRLAQMSRAVGIHLILSTQRPSVNVITGLIKANVPARIAMQVASQVDSRTILDGAGAEKLLGAGDMLYLSSDMGKPHRIQTAYISENEVKGVVSYIVKHNEPSVDMITLSGTAVESPNAIFSASLEDDVDDDLLEEAKKTVEAAGKASTSFLQRKLRIGYARAARLMDILEEKGMISAADGARPREVLTETHSGNADASEDDPVRDT